MTCMHRLTNVVFALWALAGTATAEATVTAYFSAGTTCAGQPVAKFRGGGPAFKVTLCLTATEESLCGHSLQLEADSPATSGRFEVTKHEMGANYPDPTMESQPKPLAITQPALPHDFGGTRDNPAPPAANQPLATFTLRAQSKAKSATYEIRLGKNSLVSVGKDGSCLQNSEIPISAVLKLNRQ